MTTRRTRTNQALAWILTLLCGFAIIGLGGDSFSYEETSRLLDETYRRLFPWLSADQRTVAVFLTRKLAHVVEYGVFALLAFRAALLSSRRGIGAALLAALTMSLALASLDEFRQSFSSVRGGSPLDVLIDFGGAALALSMLLAVRRWLGNPR